jgi:DNA-binding SARP family transcriptional activator
MLWRILGPLEVWTGEGWTGLGAPKWRALLAALLAERGQVVSTERLVDELWLEDPPPGARKLVSGYVSRLRRLLADPGGRVLATRAPGYQLMVVRADLDAWRFEDLLAAGRGALHNENAGEAAELLAEALALWRGPPLADVPRGPLAAAEMLRLEELRLAAVELRIEAEICCGHQAKLVPELRQLTARHPLRERFSHQLMRVLEACGRPAEAVESYARARRVIADELGADPGPDLQNLHQRILAGDAAPTVEPPAGSSQRTAIPAVLVPRELPATVRHFTGRARELRWLSALLTDSSGAGGAVVISAIGGTAGVGKTGLAVHWANQVTEHFPDGQLYVNLRGYDPDQPMPAADALARFLRALGVASQGIPLDADERAARYRSLLSGRRILVVADNAGSVEQVRPLLPGTPGCAVVVTSRDSLTGLVVRDGARRLDLDPLPSEDAVGLLRELIGGQVDADPAAAMALADQCARLPLALRVAAELAAGRRTVPLADLVIDLADQQRRLDLLEADGDPHTAVRAVFSWSYRYLDADAARTFRLLGLHPGLDLDTYAAAALTGTTVERAGQVLGHLARAHLIQPAGPCRHSLHDLLRAYARELAAQENEEEGHAAIVRILNWYMCTAHAAARVVNPSRRHVPLDPAELDGTPLAFSTYDEALDWLDAERLNLVAAVSVAADQGLHEIAWKLPITLWDLFNLRNHWADWIATHKIGLASARCLDDLLGQNWVSNNLAAAYIRTGRNLEAADLLVRVLANERRLSHRRGQAVSLTNLGVVHGNLRQPEASVESYQQALEISREIGDRRGEGVALSGLGDNWKVLGQRDRSVLSYQLALDAHRAAGDEFGEAAILLSLSQAYFAFGQTGEAVKNSRQALALNRRIGHRHAEAMTLGALGKALATDGHRDEARQCFLEAYEILDSIHDPSASEMLDHLGKFDQ